MTTWHFRREGNILQDLIHPGVPGGADSFTLADRHYLIMELIERDAAADRRPEPLRDAGAHPGNPGMSWSPPGGVLLIDSGIARLFALGRTRDTYLPGTPGFCAP